MRSTGPYQEALHQLLAEAKCKLINNNYQRALLHSADAGCDVAKLHGLIGNWRFFPGVLHNNSITDKILDHFLDELNVNLHYRKGAAGSLNDRLVCKWPNLSRWIST